MDQQKWKKVNRLVDTALELDKKERATFLQEECAGDQELKYQVTELLKAIEQSNTESFLEDAETFLGDLADEAFDDKENDYSPSLVGETIGKYRITELIGHGGMGSVFLAERADEVYNRKVAFKVLRRGMETPSNIARFKRERNILARLDHPNIARLLDGGVTVDGLPYLVMEYVEGTPLQEYCNSHQLSIAERLSLFATVCQAVQHAHRNAIIHRDLKPSNIHVTDDGTVKVLDFGIAKLISTDTSLFQTRTGSRILTLGYAAPEQFENKAITTATDSYTLGILLYELVAGSHPFQTEDKNITGIEELIRNQTPDKPSQNFKSLPDNKKAKIAKQRGTSSSALNRDLRGDIDAIVMKALRKEPKVRYVSVDQMLEDFNRYNQSLPLIAQSDTFRYRVTKFIRRNRRAVVSVSLILTAIIGFGSYHINQIAAERSIVRAEAQKAATVKNFLIDIFSSSNPQSASFEGKDISAQQLLVNGKNRIGQDLQNQPDVYTEILTAIGDALNNIDAFEEAEKSYNQALSKASETSAPLENKIHITVKLGHMITTWKRNEEAHQTALEAQSLLEEVENPSPALEASVFRLLGRIISIGENYKEGNRYFEKADSLYLSAGMQNSNDYIQMLTDYGRSLLYVFNFEKAEETLLKSNELHWQKYNKSTLTVAENYKFIAWTNREMGNFERSNEYFIKSIELKSELIGSESVRTAESMYHLARNHTLIGNFKKSERLAEKVLDIYQGRSTRKYIHQAKSYAAVAKYNQSKWAEAEKLLKNVVEERRKIEGTNKMLLAGSAARLAVVYKNMGRFQEAISILEETIEINKRNLGPHSRGVGVDMVKLAAVYRVMGKYKKAREYFVKAESIFEDEVPDVHYRTAELYLQYGRLEQDVNNHRKAREYFNRAHNIYLDIFGSDSNRTKEAKSLLEKMAQA